MVVIPSRTTIPLDRHSECRRWISLLWNHPCNRMRMFCLISGDVSLTAQQDVPFFMYHPPLERQALPHVNPSRSSFRALAKNLLVIITIRQVHVKMYRSTSGDVSLNAQQDVLFKCNFHLLNVNLSRTSIPLDRHSERKRRIFLLLKPSAKCTWKCTVAHQEMFR